MSYEDAEFAMCGRITQTMSCLTLSNQARSFVLAPRAVGNTITFLLLVKARTIIAGELVMGITLVCRRSHMKLNIQFKTKL